MFESKDLLYYTTIHLNKSCMYLSQCHEVLKCTCAVCLIFVYCVYMCISYSIAGSVVNCIVFKNPNGSSKVRNSMYMYMYKKV